MSLEVRGLSIRIGDRDVVENVSFTIAAGERVGIVGESGSGKSLTALALLGLLPPGAHASGSIRWDGTEILGLAEKELKQIRGAQIGMVFQEPQTALNPIRTIARQIAEPARLHERLTRRQTRQRASELAELVGLPEPAEIISRYPHQLSGGQRQRVSIASALSARPRLLIADEPTTALDVTVQAEILDLFDNLVTERDSSLLFITHDLAVLARIADTAIVLSRGRVVERASVADLLVAPQSDLGITLLEAARRTGYHRPGGSA